MRSASLLCLLLVLGCDADAPDSDFDIEFRPSPGCPQCTIKKAQFTIPPASTLGGVGFGASTLVHEVTLTHDCTPDPTPCDRIARDDLGRLGAGRYEVPTLIETDWDLGDTEEASVDVVVIRQNRSQYVVNIQADVVE